MEPAHTAQDLLEQATQLFKAGRLPKAEKLCQEILEQDPQDPQTLNLMGLIALKAQHLESALGYLYKAAVLDQTKPAYLLNLGAALLEDAKNDGSFGRSVYAVKRMQEALSCYVKAASLEPQDAKAAKPISKLVGQLQRAGIADRVIATLVEPGCNHPLVLGLYSSLAPSASKTDQAIRSLQDFLSHTTESTPEYKGLYRLLGLLHDRQANYDQAFAAYQRANSMESKPSNLDLTRKVDHLIQTFVPETMPKISAEIPNTDLPVFTVGLPTSGVALIARILGSHPDVVVTEEPISYPKLSKKLPQLDGVPHSYPEAFLGWDPTTVDEVAAQQIQRLRALGPVAQRVVDRNLMNFLYLPLIVSLFPKAHIIYCHRDALDTCLGIYFQSSKMPAFYGSDLVDIGRFYQEHERLMNHWRSVLSIPMLKINFENLLYEPERMSRKVIEFCGLAWDDRCLLGRPAAEGNPEDQPDITLSPERSVGRWRNYEKYLQPLMAVIHS